MINLYKYTKGFNIQLKPLIKDVYNESWENGQGDYVQSMDINYLALNHNLQDFQLSENKTIQDLIVNHLQKNLHCELTKEFFSCVDDRLIIQVYEDIDGNYINYCYDNKDKKVYSCMYDFCLKINGIEVGEADLKEIFEIL